MAAVGDRAQAPTTGLQAISDIAAAWARGLAVVVAVFYGAGFLVVNTYLGSYGVRDLEPLRARYIAAGLSFVLLASLAAFVGIRIFDSLMRFERSERRLLRFLTVTALPAAYVAVTLTLLFVLSALRASGVRVGEWSWTYAANVGTFGMLAVVSVLVIRKRRHDWHTWLGGAIALSSLTLVVLALVTYATAVYPSIPNWLGGGNPDTVELVLEDPARDCTPCGVGTVKLIDDDNSRIVVLIENADGSLRAVEIARSKVRAIIHSRTPAPLTLP